MLNRHNKIRHSENISSDNVKNSSYDKDLKLEIVETKDLDDGKTKGDAVENVVEHVQKHEKEKDPILDVRSKTRATVKKNMQSRSKCEFKLSDKASFKRHSRIQSDVKLYKCKLRDKSFPRSVSLKTHVVTHTRETPFLCEVCNDQFSDHNALVNHNKTHTKEKVFRCKSYARSTQLRGRMRQHSGKNPSCDSEEKHFYDEVSELKVEINEELTEKGDPLHEAHLESYEEVSKMECKTKKSDDRITEAVFIKVENEMDDFFQKSSHEKDPLRDVQVKSLSLEKRKAPFFCSICESEFSSKFNLKQHSRIHSGVKPYKCKLCDKSFTQSISLKTHVRIHTGETPFPCKTCSKQFSNHSNLVKHNKTHTKEKPFQCEICSKSFTQSTHLKGHMRIHTRPYGCEHCAERFAQKCALNRHNMQIHNSLEVREDVLVSEKIINHKLSSGEAQDSVLEGNPDIVFVKNECENINFAPN